MYLDSYLGVPLTEKKQSALANGRHRETHTKHLVANITAAQAASRSEQKRLHFIRRRIAGEGIAGPSVKDITARLLR